jgi:hypothetical protein
MQTVDHSRRLDLSGLALGLAVGTVLNMYEPLDPTTWSLSLQQRDVVPLKTFTDTIHFPRPVFVDVGFTETGERLYVSLEEAIKASKSDDGGKKELEVWHEAKVKGIEMAVMSTASYGYGSSYNSWTVIEELGLGTNKFVLCNEAILTTNDIRSRPSYIFENASLILNCHKTEQEGGGRYSVKAKAILYYPIHTLMAAAFRPGGETKVIAVLKKFNEAIWEGLQTGNVFVHCLAGVHRAACVAVSHYLWRFYVLKHTHLSSDIQDIYSQLAERRPGVAALGYKIFVEMWQSYLDAQYPR